MATTIQYELPAGAFSALRMAPDDFAQEMKLAACVQWYHQGTLSQSKASEIAGLSRAEFLVELSRREEPILQVTEDELAGELEHIREARR
jgi:predicted HTH domain antitoxin